LVKERVDASVLIYASLVDEPIVSSTQNDQAGNQRDVTTRDNGLTCLRLFYAA
jgi:hypothetical protein